MNKDVHLLEEKYDQVKEGAISNTLAWGANKLAGTKMGKGIGDNLISRYAKDAAPEDLQWLANNIDDENALKQRASPDSEEQKAEDAAQQFVHQLIQQPNLRQVVKDYLAKNGYTTGETQPQQPEPPVIAPHDDAEFQPGDPIPGVDDTSDLDYEPPPDHQPQTSLQATTTDDPLELLKKWNAQLSIVKGHRQRDDSLARMRYM